MSYNFLIEGDLDYEALSLAAARHPNLEVFPIPAQGGAGNNALGVALPFRNVANGISEVQSFVREALANGLVITDLDQGVGIADEADLDHLIEGLQPE